VDVYLMQHGEAKLEREDPTRPLTDAGRGNVERVARRAASSGVHLDVIYHSGILRAAQSAEILAGALAAGVDVREREGLTPLEPVEPVAQWLLEQAPAQQAIAVVGHLPFVERLAARLVARDEAAQVVAFRNAGLVKLVPKRQADGFAVAWVLWPELA
jgi:phosphohistidine phosphatase